MATTKYFTLDLVQIEANSEADPRICAKMTEPDPEETEVTRVRYYIKVNVVNGKVFDPVNDIITVRTRGTNSPDNWKFRRVNESCFGAYFKYLETRNKNWLSNAEREVVNGYKE